MRIYQNELFTAEASKTTYAHTVLLSIKMNGNTYNTFVPNDEAVKEVLSQIEILGEDFFNIPSTPDGWWVN